jgi:sulfide:quinone oxidoreductase
MGQRVVVLGAGFAGLELATVLSEALGDDVDVTLIDMNDGFVFGYSKLDVMFGRTTLERPAFPTATSRSPACASSSRRSPRSIPRRGA